MNQTITLASAKGGTGKTTTGLNLAVAFAERGRPTLLVDADPQGAVALALAKSEGEWNGLHEYLTDQAGVDDVVMKSKLEALSILPRGRLDMVEVDEFVDAIRSGGLERLISALKDRFRYIVVDTPAGVGAITRAALKASDFVLVPLQAEPLSLRSLSQVLSVVEHVREASNPELKLLGILPTMVKLGHDPSVNVMRALWAELGGVLDTAIPRSDQFAVASERGLPVAFMAGPPSAEARRFEVLAAECESLMAELSGAAGEGDERAERELV